jgi:hypothetical protein
MRTQFQNACLAGAICLAAAACADGAKVKQYEAAEQVGNARLTNFDDLDFNVFSNQKWDEFPKSHAKDIEVHYPDGHITKGLDQHIAELKVMFVYAPDTKIREHPVRLASGDWTAVVGVMEGTFTKPMPIGGGKFIQPTGKAFKLPMSTFGHWKDGVMFEEFLFWDSQSYMQQMGIGK